MSKLSQITKQFKRFALYDDLKNLHTMVLPEIAKFENKLLENQNRVDQFELVVRDLDEVVTMKQNK
jgi:hypothetical protein